MPRYRIVAAGLVASLLLCAGSAAIADQDEQDFSTIARGRYLTLAGDCAACHTAEGGKALAGGRPIETPFGDLLSPNITPDRETGIGAWTDQQFIDAMTKGKGPLGDHLYPAMPYPNFTKVTRKDLLAIRAYLATVPPARHAVQVDQLPFPFDYRASMIAWDALFFRSGTFRPRGDKSAAWNRGAYLVEGLMHCGACHTPKNFLGADESHNRFRGYVVQRWFAPDLTVDNRRGIGGWSADDIVAYLKTGHNRFADATGPMGDEVLESSSKLADSDLRAVATYLKDQPDPGETLTTPLASDDRAMKMGAAIYRDECSACHTPTGRGIAGMFPSLAGSASVQSKVPTSLIHIVLRGARSVATNGAPTAPAMPPFGWLLNDDQVAAVVTYIRNAWGNAAAKVVSGTVRDERRTLKKSAAQE
jgi:mono/diheme cytochrome c family protein